MPSDRAAGSGTAAIVTALIAPIGSASLMRYIAPLVSDTTYNPPGPAWRSVTTPKPFPKTMLDCSASSEPVALSATPLDKGPLRLSDLRVCVRLMSYSTPPSRTVPTNRSCVYFDPSLLVSMKYASVGATGVFQLSFG